MTGIYIHVPFCRRKCPYCDFYSVTSSESLREEYVGAVCRNISAYAGKGIKADTLYFGGGTPSVLTAGQVRDIIKTARDSFGLDNAEITLEANPSSVDLEKLGALKAAGVNRLSFGIQSADDGELKFLGRLHDFKTAEKAVENAAKAGFENISADIMLGLKGQTAESLQKSLEKFVKMPVKHVSAYMLKIEEGTAFDKDEIRNAVADEDTLSDMYLQTVGLLEKSGFEQYEISNFAKDKAYSKHNLKYWHGGEYLGFGPGAHSFYNGTRSFCPKNVYDFVKSKQQEKIVLEEQVDKLEEYIMLNLRIKSGVEFSRIEQLADESFANEVLAKARIYEKNGLCKVEDGRLSLTPKGFLVSNALIGDLIG